MSKYHFCLLSLVTNFFYLTPQIASSANSLKSFELRYASIAWNKNPKNIDSAFMFILDKNSGKVVKINVDESAPDSSLFTGKFSIQWDSAQEVIPEVYIPPVDFRGDGKSSEKFNNLLKTGAVSPQPLAKKEVEGKFALEVFDTQDQADRAQKVYEDQIAAEKNAKQAELIKPKLSDSSLQVLRMANQAIALAKLADEAAKRETDRLHLEQIEAQRMLKNKQDMQNLAADEKNSRKGKAAQYAQAATKAYELGDFKNAEILYKKAVDLDPEALSYYFKYAVTLYRNQKFSDALIALKLSEVDASEQNEKIYYMGLIHFKLNDLPQAKSEFEIVKKSDNIDLAASAAFYAGLARIALDELPEAQANFEFVLDTSKDPGLDRKAEEYIEQIARLIQFKKIASKKYLLNASAGLIYDSNILQNPDNDSGSATSVGEGGGARWALSGTGNYRAFYKEKSDLSVKIGVSDTESFSTDFIEADATILSASLPYNLKGTFRKKAYQLGIFPGYEYMWLRDGNGTIYSALQSNMLILDLMLVMRENWLSSYSLEGRLDNSFIPDSALNDADATKILFKKTELLFLDAAKKKNITGQLGFTTNKAKGEEKIYSRFEFLALYSAPILTFRNLAWNTGVTAYKQTYTESAANRKDTNVGFLLGFQKSIDANWGYTINFSHTDNTSTDNSYDYSKQLLMVNLNYSWDH